MRVSIAARAVSSRTNRLINSEIAPLPRELNGLQAIYKTGYQPGSSRQRGAIRVNANRKVDARAQRGASLHQHVEKAAAVGIDAARLVTVFGASFNTDEVISRAHTLLKVIDAELAKTPFLAGSTPTIADIANYSYIAHAPEGNVSLEPYANVRNWLARIEALPRFVPMPRTVIGLQTHA